MEKWVSLETLYKGNRVSSSVVTINRRNSKIIGERKTHYPIRKRQIGIRQKFFDRSVHVLFFDWEGYLLALLLQLSRIVANLGLLVSDVHWPVMM